MGNQFSFFQNRSRKARTWNLNIKERGIQRLCAKCERQCKVLGSSEGPEISSKFLCFVFKAKGSNHA